MFVDLGETRGHKPRLQQNPIRLFISVTGHYEAVNELPNQPKNFRTEVLVKTDDFFFMNCAADPEPICEAKPVHSEFGKCREF